MESSGRYFGVALLKQEGATIGRTYSAAEKAEAKAMYAARAAKWSPFAKRMAEILNPGEGDVMTGDGWRGWYEVSHETLIEDIMKIEAELAAELNQR